MALILFVNIAFMENSRLRYRLDFAFFCQEGKIDVECDNQKWHDRPAQKARDKERNHYLKDHGWTVLRFFRQRHKR